MDKWEYIAPTCTWDEAKKQWSTNEVAAATKTDVLGTYRSKGWELVNSAPNWWHPAGSLGGGGVVSWTFFFKRRKR